MSSVTTFGAFVELSPGCEGLVHISELDYGFVADASQVIKVRRFSPSRALSLIYYRRKPVLDLQGDKL